MAEPIEFESRMFKCPECEVMWQTAVPSYLPMQAFKLCSRCYRRWYAESDRDDDPKPRRRPDVDYPLFKNRHKD